MDDVRVSGHRKFTTSVLVCKFLGRPRDAEKRTRAPMTTTYHLSFRYWFSPTQGYPRGRGESLFTALPAAATGDNPETEGRRAWSSASCDFLRHPFASVGFLWTVMRVPICFLRPSAAFLRARRLSVDGDARGNRLPAALCGIPSRSSAFWGFPMRVATRFLLSSAASFRACRPSVGGDARANQLSAVLYGILSRSSHSWEPPIRPSPDKFP